MLCVSTRMHECAHTLLPDMLGLRTGAHQQFVSVD